MQVLLERVRRFIRQHGLADTGTRVVVALSGGSDSVALAHLVRELDAAGELRAAGAAHFNHQLRPSADDDERFCARLAESFNWPLLVGREDVAARARVARQSIEHAARTARHDFLERARVQLGADVVAVGHTKDDQAETFLLRLLRGAGPRGLSAMHPRNGPIIRPLLACRREALRGYLADRQAAYVEDESNADFTIPRNRIRGDLLPRLAAEFNPAIVDVLADEAELARELWQWLEDEAARFAEGAPDAGHLSVPALTAAPPALRRLVVWLAMCRAAGNRSVSFDHVGAALQLLESRQARAVDAPGHRVERVGEKLVLTSRPEGSRGRWHALPQPSKPGYRANLFDYSLSIPGEVRIPLAGCTLSAETSENTVDAGRVAADVATVRRDLCGPRLRVRNRRPGDWFRPAGLGGRKKLQDFFVDRKVARQRRDLVPLVVDEGGRIIWVAGYEIDEAFRVTDPAQAVLILRLKLLGGPA
jgi:tRNA(Ile)-lysidine synthase